MTTQKLAAIREFSVRTWIRSWFEYIAASVVAYVFSFPLVQQAFAEQVQCHSPIGEALNNHIRDQINEIDPGDFEADELRGFERAVEHIVENYSKEFDQALDELQEKLEKREDYDLSDLSDSVDILEGTVQKEVREFGDTLRWLINNEVETRH